MKNEETPGSLDAALDEILRQFAENSRLDFAHERMEKALRRRLGEQGYDERVQHLLLANLFGSLSGWMEFLLTEKAAGRDAVPDFARLLRRAFLSHCRQHDMPAEEAISMAVELASVIMDLAIGFRRHLSLEEEE
jgi:hypothetical protein